MPWNDDYYSILESLYGRRVSAAVGESHRCAIAKVGRVVQEEGIDCDFRTVDGYLFPHQDTRSTLNTLLQVRHRDAKPVVGPWWTKGLPVACQGCAIGMPGAYQWIHHPRGGSSLFCLVILYSV